MVFAETEADLGTELLEPQAGQSVRCLSNSNWCLSNTGNRSHGNWSNTGNGSQWNRSHWNWGNNWNSGSYSRRSIWDSVLVFINARILEIKDFLFRRGFWTDHRNQWYRDKRSASLESE